MSWTTSQVIYPDITPPSSGAVYVGHNENHQSLVHCSAFTVHWQGFVDNESVSLNFEIGIGSTKIHDDAEKFQSAASTFTHVLNTELHEGHAYYALVKVGQSICYT